MYILFLNNNYCFTYNLYFVINKNMATFCGVLSQNLQKQPFVESWAPFYGLKYLIYFFGSVHLIFIYCSKQTPLMPISSSLSKIPFSSFIYLFIIFNSLPTKSESSAHIALRKRDRTISVYFFFLVYANYIILYLQECGNREVAELKELINGGEVHIIIN